MFDFNVDSSIGNDTNSKELMILHTKEINGQSKVPVVGTRAKYCCLRIDIVFVTGLNTLTRQAEKLI